MISVIGYWWQAFHSQMQTLSSQSKMTYQCYKSGWKHFATWCESKDVDPTSATVIIIVAYRSYITAIQASHSENGDKKFLKLSSIHRLGIQSAFWTFGAGLFGFVLFIWHSVENWAISVWYLADICQQAFWQSPSTFVKHYHWPASISFSKVWSFGFAAADPTE